MKYITISRWIVALAAAALSSLAVAQAPVDISFYYPVVVVLAPHVQPGAGAAALGA